MAVVYLGRVASVSSHLGNCVAVLVANIDKMIRRHRRGRGRGHVFFTQLDTPTSATKLQERSDLFEVHSTPHLGRPVDTLETGLPIGEANKHSLSLFHEIEKLQTLEPSEIVLRLSELQDGLQEFVECITPTNLLLFLTVLSRALKSNTQRPKKHVLMEKLLESKLFTVHISALLHSALAETHVVDIYRNLLVIFRAYVRMMPLVAVVKLADCIDLCVKMTCSQRWVKIPMFVDIKKAMTDIECSVQDVLKQMQPIESQKVRANVEDASGDVAVPSTFRQIPTIPMIEDTTTNSRPFFQKNIVDVKYQSVDHYLDVHFHLLREYYIALLRQAMNDHASERFSNTNEIFIYSGVKIEKPVYKTDGILYEIHFTASTGLRLPHKLTPGSLLCLTTDNFHTVLYATVSQPSVNKCKQGTLLVKFEHEHNKVSKLIGTEQPLLYDMIELCMNFKVYRRVLEGLQLLSSDKMPLKEYIVHSQRHVDPPQYLDHNATFDLSFVSAVNTYKQSKKPITKQGKDHPRKTNEFRVGTSECSGCSQVCVLDFRKWPSSNKLSLDASQRRALHFALTSSVAIIQGQPGTGKTYLAHKIVNTLLHNRDVWQTPKEATSLLLIFMTTNALDQFLAELTISAMKLVRIAGRSKKEDLNRYNVHNFPQGNKSSAEELRQELRHIKGKIEEQQAKLQLLDYNVLHESQLQELTGADAQLVSSLTRDFSETVGVQPTNQTWCPKSFLAAWLVLTFDNFISEDEIEAFYHYVDDNVHAVLDPKTPMTNTANDATSLAYKLDNDPNTALIEMCDDDNDSWSELLPDHFATDIDSFSVPISRDSWAVHVQSLANPFEYFPEEKTLGAIMIPLYLALGNVRKAIAEREMHKTRELDDIHVSTTTNAWLLPLHERWCLYRRWVNLYRGTRMNEINTLREEYNSTACRLTNTTKAEILSVLQQSDIVCTTITGATLYQEILHEMNSKIVLVQEAEGKLESHLVTALSPHTQHLILIGDYRQCQPKLVAEELAKDCTTAVSLFGRLIKNNMHHETLEVQHRMRPEIASLLVPLKYPELNNHISVQSYANIEGLSKNVYFVNHDFIYTDSAPETENHGSQFEAEFLLGLCRYLIEQGYEPQAITIVTLCPQQVSFLLSLMKKETFVGVCVVTVENFKGEEGDIILLTVCSNNCKEKALSFENVNQISIALSRARKGLYCCGNFEYLSKSSMFYQQLTATLERSGSIGNTLELKCQKHPNCKRYVACGNDFRRLSPRGGCLLICLEMQPCGHYCQQVCHLDGHSKCTDVMKVFPMCQHSVLLPCSQDISKVKCVTKVRRQLKKCGHTVLLECHIDVIFHKCAVKVKHIFPQCKHQIEVECSRNRKAIVCPEDCDYRLDCGHRCPLACHPVDDQSHIDVLCTKPCKKKICERDHRCKMRCCEPCNICRVMVEKVLACGHKAKVACHQDVQDVAVLCDKPCQRILGCGHPCQQVCTDPCGKCDVMVQRRIPECGHMAKMRCMFSTDVIKCCQPCNRYLLCGHTCTNKCYEPCVLQCNHPVTYSMRTCGHTNTVPCHKYHKSETTATLCQALCGQLLPCEHQCKGLCGECRQGRVHMPCRESCKRILICGHKCETPCSQSCMPCKCTCENRCVHSRCPKKCGQPCKRCWEACSWQCPHFKCDKHCNEFCTRPRCNEPCFHLLHCGHSCIGLCGEICPSLCRVCNKDELTEFVLYGNEEEDNARFIQLEDCGHCIEVEALDHWMDMDGGEIQMKGCPRCKTTIWRSLRYGNVVRRRILDVQHVKKRLFGSNRKLRDTIYRLQDMLTLKGTIRVDFPEENRHLQRRLNQQVVLHQNELVVIENQVNMLELMIKMKEKTKKMTLEARSNFFSDMKLLGQRLMQNEERITEYELNQINCEIRRLFLVAAATDTEAQLAHRTNALCAGQLARAKELLDHGSALTNAEEKEIEVALEAALQLRGGLGISELERVAIVAAMGFAPGHWYKCPNGHIYAIADCGGAMQVSNCNECGARIGGQSHALLADNAHAREMDGSRHPAWSEEANIVNYMMQ